MITGPLTKEQEALLPVYREQYRAIGLSTTPCNRAEAERALKESQAYLKIPVPEIRWFDSPEAGAIEAAKEANGTENPTAQQVRDQAWQASYGSFNAYWVSFYAFIAEQLPVNKDNLIDIVKRIIENCGVYWTFEGLIIATEKPVAIGFDSERRLHNPNDLALKYKDGTGVAAINGIRLPQWIVKTPASDITKEMILKETNADFRRCIIQKIGIARAIEVLGATVIDTYDSSVGGRYELLSIDYDGRGEQRPYLKMANPSMPGVFHIEGVRPGTKTVKEAICYRNGLKTFIEAEVLS